MTMRDHLSYNKIARRILENKKTSTHKKLLFNLLSKSLEIEPNFFGTYHLFGIYYGDLNDFLNAEINYKKSIELNKNNIPSYLNLFTLYYNQEKINKALEIGNQIINLENFDFGEFYTQLAMCYLLKGDFYNGWKYYEYLKPKEKLNDILNFKGEIIIFEEQGLGDNILFSRYGKLLKDKGLKVSYACTSKLISLIKSSKIYYKVYDIERLNWKDNTKKYVPLFNLPRLFNINPNNSKIQEPYFFADEKKINYWKNKINSQKIIIGINWQGSKEDETQIGRSIELLKFKEISKISYIQLVSLQNGYGKEQLKYCDFKDKILDFGDNLSFNDISAIIMNCDLIISTDTMIPHLSGALGKETWMLIKKIPHWLWKLSTEENMWYSSVKLFRQSKNDDWEDIFERVKNKLINIQELYNLKSSMDGKPVRTYQLDVNRIQDLDDVKKILNGLELRINNNDKLYDEVGHLFITEVVPRGYIPLLEKLGYEEIAKMTYEEMEQKIIELKLLQNEETN